MAVLGMPISAVVLWCEFVMVPGDVFMALVAKRICYRAVASVTVYAEVFMAVALAALVNSSKLLRLIFP